MRATTDRTQPVPPLWLAVLPVAVLVGLILVQIRYFEGDPHIPLILASAVAAMLGVSQGQPWARIEDGIVQGIAIALKAILILMVVGLLIGTWIAGGIVPMMIYYGLKILHPDFFLSAACLICCVVSMATGSSWTTAGTVGVALIGVGQGLGLSLPMTAGAIVSGAYFGDKMSPLSDSTNLAPAVAGSELFAHIRHMVYTTVPALVISLVLYSLLGLWADPSQVETEKVTLIMETLAKSFHLHPLLLGPPLLVILTVVMRIPALPALIGGAALGGLCAGWFQGQDVKTIFQVAHYGYEAQTGVDSVDKLLSRGGLDSMMYTVSLILCALTFGGIMERTGMLTALARAILSQTRSTGSLILATVGSCIGMNIIAPDQYLSIIVPGRMYRQAYEQRGLHPKNLSRTLEDAGTLSSPLVAWNTCGAFMTGTLMVSPLAYAPFAFLNLITPVIAVIYGYTGWFIERSKPPGEDRKTTP